MCTRTPKYSWTNGLASRHQLPRIPRATKVQGHGRAMAPSPSRTSCLQRCRPPEASDASPATEPRDSGAGRAPPPCRGVSRGQLCTHVSCPLPGATAGHRRPGDISGPCCHAPGQGPLQSHGVTVHCPGPGTTGWELEQLPPPRDPLGNTPPVPATSGVLGPQESCGRPTPSPGAHSCSVAGVPDHQQAAAGKLSRGQSGARAWVQEGAISPAPGPAAAAGLGVSPQKPHPVRALEKQVQVGQPQHRKCGADGPGADSG